jgi:hypothetical protein
MRYFLITLQGIFKGILGIEVHTLRGESELRIASLQHHYFFPRTAIT